MATRQAVWQTRDTRAGVRCPRPTGQHSSPLTRRSAPPITLIESAMTNRGSLSGADVLQLQRIIGNGAFCREIDGRSTMDPREPRGRQGDQQRGTVTSLPDSLKHGVEALSGLSLD